MMPLGAAPWVALVADILLALVLVLGAAFALIGAIGLARFSDFMTRVHGPTKASTLGVGSVLVASLIHFSVNGTSISLHEILITAFVFVTAPVSAHMLVKALLLRRQAEVPPQPETAARHDTKPSPDRSQNLP